MEKGNITKDLLFVEYDSRLFDKTKNLYKIENGVINIIEDNLKRNRFVFVYNTFNRVLETGAEEENRFF
jgi:hypothetical protein